MITQVVLHSQIKKMWNRFDRDRMVRRVMKKFVLKFWLYALRFRRKIKRYGPTFSARNHRMLQCHINATCLIFESARDRAKNMIKDFLSVRAGVLELADRMSALLPKVTLIQRSIRVRQLIFKNSRWFGTFNDEVIKAKIALTI